MSNDQRQPTEDELLAATGSIFKELGLADKIVFAGDDGEMQYDCNTGEKTWTTGGCCGGGCGSKSTKSVLRMMDQIEQRDQTS